MNRPLFHAIANAMQGFILFVAGVSLYLTALFQIAHWIAK